MHFKIDKVHIMNCRIFDLCSLALIQQDECTIDMYIIYPVDRLKFLLPSLEPWGFSFARVKCELKGCWYQYGGRRGDHARAGWGCR
jgi:hypothetical protein